MKKFREILGNFRKETKANGCLMCDLFNKFGNPILTMPDEFEKACDYILEHCNELVLDRHYKDSLFDLNNLTTTLSDALTIAGENPAKYLPSVWSKDTFIHTIFNQVHLGMCVIDSEIRERAEVGYILEQNKVEIGVSGYSEKLGKSLPNYITKFDDYIFVINPIKGYIERSAKRYAGELRKVDGKVYVSDIKIATEDNFGGLAYSNVLFEKQMYDAKLSEKEKAKAEGKNIKDTDWMTSALGTLRGSNKYIRCHTFICLMVYGYEQVRLAMTEANSCYTIDHINSKHSDNRIDNLALVSRKANNQKKGTDLKIFDYFLYFNDLPQIEVAKEEIVGNKVEIKTVSTVSENKVDYFTKTATQDDILALLRSKGLCPMRVML